MRRSKSSLGDMVFRVYELSAGEGIKFRSPNSEVTRTAGLLLQGELSVFSSHACLPDRQLMARVPYYSDYSCRTELAAQTDALYVCICPALASTDMLAAAGVGGNPAGFNYRIGDDLSIIPADPAESEFWIILRGGKGI